MKISEKKINSEQLQDMLPNAVLQHRTDTQTREEWVGARTRSIGASDVAAMLGCDPWRTPLQLALQKRGGPGTEENRAMQRGTRMEPLIRQWTEEDTGCPIYTVPFLLRNPRVSFLTANLDGLGVTSDGRPFVVEIKDSSHDLDVYAHIAEHGMPPSESAGGAAYKYWLQVQSQLAITGCDLACFAVADRATLHVYWWAPQPEVQSYIEDVARKWWPLHVTDAVDPPARGADLAILRSLCPPDPDGEAVDLTEDAEAEAAMREYEEAKECRLLVEKEVKEHKDKENNARARLEQLMGDAPVARVGAREATRKVVSRDEYTVAASSYVRFGVRKAKRVRK
jgi:putative phage-type endonuclease